MMNEKQYYVNIYFNNEVVDSFERKEVQLMLFN